MVSNCRRRRLASSSRRMESAFRLLPISRRSFHTRSHLVKTNGLREQPTVVGVVHEVGACGVNTDPDCDGGVGIGFGSTRTWKYQAPPVLSTNATFVPSIESSGDVLICPPVCVTVL